MKPFVYALAALMIVCSCGKKEGTVITPENVRDVLTQYGAANPETGVEIETEFGTIRLKLYTETPLHRANFIKQIKEGYYDNADFYRIVYEFMIQAGDQHKSLPYRVPSEFKPDLFHKRGALAMARTDDNNPNLESSSTEFYIVQGHKYADWAIEEDARNAGVKLTPEQRQTYLSIGGEMNLDQKYTVFGEVVSGLEAVDAIASQKAYNERPNKKIPIKVRLTQ